MANLDYTIKYKVDAIASGIRLVGKSNIPWTAYPSGYTLMSGAPNVPATSLVPNPIPGLEYTWIYRVVSEESSHEVTNIVVESNCVNGSGPATQMGDIIYAYNPICNTVSYTRGTAPISGADALIFTWTSLCTTCSNVKEYVITYVEQGSGNIPFSVTIPIATVKADPSFPTYTAYITDSVDPLITYDVTFETILTMEADVTPSVVDPSGHITVEFQIPGCINP